MTMTVCMTGLTIVRTLHKKILLMTRGVQLRQWDNNGYR